MGLFDSPTPFKGQDYSTLKKSCLETAQPFEDPEFPTTSSSLFFTPDKVWSRSDGLWVGALHMVIQ